MCCVLQVIWVFSVSFKQITKSSCWWTTIHWRVTAETTTSSPNCAYSIAMTGLTGSNVICHHNLLVKRYVTLCDVPIEQSAAELLRFQCLTLWPWTLRYVTLWPRSLTRWPWKFMARHITWSNYVRNLSEIEQSPAELLILFANFCTRFVTLWHLPWPLDLELL